eukprot:TRINITY_DN5344_c0_g1_i1.p1 TRINITY_DN5344_c0_g1~~TRINITY_DN5344_c0_g1_i1.p1  ORF type:complete len:577 (+),score=65.13 TRINITY_DN5344_c0_g1_i1:55-1785(+)
MQPQKLRATLINSQNRRSQYNTKSYLSTGVDDWLDAYAELIKGVIQDNIVYPGEKSLIDAYRLQHGLTNADHIRALHKIGKTEMEWDLAVAQGTMIHPEEKYGSVTLNGEEIPTKFYDPETPEFHRKPMVWGNGAVIIPYLRQWYSKIESEDENVEYRFKPKVGETVYVRQMEEHKASYLELFFDLVFVTVIRKLAYIVEHDPRQMLEFLLLYTVIWMIWLQMTQYSNRYEHRDWMHVPVYFCTMFGTVALSLEIGSAASQNFEGSQVFATCYVIASLPVLFMYLLCAILETIRGDLSLAPFKREKTYHPLAMLFVTSISIIPWILSTIVQDFYYGFWAIGLIFLKTSTIVVSIIFNKTAPIAIDHWGERISLFVMIHLGESMFAISDVLIRQENLGEKTGQVYLASAIGLIIGFSIRRVYFEVEGEPKERHALRDKILFHLWNICHWILCMCIVIFAVGQLSLQNLLINEIHLDTLLHNNSYIVETPTSGHKRWVENIEPVTPTVVDTETFTNVTATTDTIQKLMESVEEEQPFKWVYCASLGIIIFVISIIGRLSTTDNQDKMLAPSMYQLSPI